jgi:hypothetical protein
VWRYLCPPSNVFFHISDRFLVSRRARAYLTSHYHSPQEMIARDMRNSELQIRVQHYEARNQMLEEILSGMPLFQHLGTWGVRWQAHQRPPK